jgi:energy-coupling factor transport system permease protein
MRYRLVRYVATESRLHGLDSAVKFAVFGLVVASVFAAGSWLGLAIVAVYVFALCALSGVTVVFYLSSLRYFMWMFALAFAINVVFPRGYGAAAFSYEALSIAGLFSVRLALMITTATVLTVVTCPSEIGDALLALAQVRGRAGRRVADCAAVLSIALRFVPVMFEEAERIRDAQTLRGHRARGLTGRVRLAVRLIVPLIEASLRRAANLGYALEARCYGYRVPRSPGLRFGGIEFIFGSSGILLLVGLLLMR